MILAVEEVKTHLRIQHDEEDAYIEGLIRQAQGAAEDFCRSTFESEAPEPVRLAVLLMVSHYYENRDNPDRIFQEELDFLNYVLQYLKKAWKVIPKLMVLIQILLSKPQIIHLLLIQMDNNNN